MPQKDASESASAENSSLQSQRSKRGKWGSDIQFILTCIGYSVGLGNVWRFPLKAYENGGGAFLVPYLICSMVIGFPVLFLEMSLGQFTNAGPGTIFRKLCPLLQGIGWGQAAMSFVVSIYYNVIVAWTLLYLWFIIIGQWSQFARCDNHFNTEYCYSSINKEVVFDNITLTDESTTKYFFYNNQTYPYNSFNETVHGKLAEIRLSLNHNGSIASTAASQFFTHNILKQSKGIEDIGGMNWELLVALALAWFLTGLCLIKGVKWIGRVALITATVPYIIIGILFFRSVTLDGARKGVDFYLLQPNWSYLKDFETWKQAATHVCFSLGIGFGGLLSLSSFNDRSHNCFRDAAIVTFADGFMSVFGGTAVFSVLGYMAKQANREIKDVVEGGVGLAFIAYPEAMSQMPAPFIWAFLFFAMLFTLGISSQFGYAEVVCTAITDQFPHVRKYRAYIVCGVCSSAFIFGLIMCTEAGIFYFYLFNEHSSSFSLMFIIAAELILVNHIYGYRNFKQDLQSMFGIREKGATLWQQTKYYAALVFGRKGFYIAYMMIAICPSVYTAMGIYAIYGLANIEDKYNNIEFPRWSKKISVFIAGIGLLIVVILAIVNTFVFRKHGKSWKKLVCVQKDWPKRKLFEQTRPEEMETVTKETATMSPNPSPGSEGVTESKQSEKGIF